MPEPAAPPPDPVRLADLRRVSLRWLWPNMIPSWLSDRLKPEVTAMP